MAETLLLADATVGKLARWLRWLGYDTVYIEGDPDAVAGRARSTGRVLLTRDQSFIERTGLHVVLVRSSDLEAQLAQVLADLGWPARDAPQRCMACNVPLAARTVDEVQAWVPPYIAETHREFHQCPRCKKVYWPGTHWVAMRERLAALREIGE